MLYNTSVFYIINKNEWCWIYYYFTMIQTEKQSLFMCIRDSVFLRVWMSAATHNVLLVSFHTLCLQINPKPARLSVQLQTKCQHTILQGRFLTHAQAHIPPNITIQKKESILSLSKPSKILSFIHTHRPIDGRQRGVKERGSQRGRREEQWKGDRDKGHSSAVRHTAGVRHRGPRSSALVAWDGPDVSGFCAWEISISLACGSKPSRRTFSCKTFSAKPGAHRKRFLSSSRLSVFHRLVWHAHRRLFYWE